MSKPKLEHFISFSATVNYLLIWNPIQNHIYVWQKKILLSLSYYNFWMEISKRNLSANLKLLKVLFKIAHVG